MRVSRDLGRQAISYFRDRRVKPWRKWLGVLALGYAVFPLDAIPDVLPVVGWLDDVGVLSAAMLFITRDIKRHASTKGPSGVSFEASESEREINPPPSRGKSRRW